MAKNGKSINGFVVIVISIVVFMLLLGLVLALDTTIPSINSINNSPSTLSAGDIVNITVNATDNARIVNVLIDINTTNNNSMKQIVSNDSLFNDNFETGILSNEWKTSGVGTAWAISSSNPFKGSFHIRAEPANLGGSAIATNISTIGFTDISFSFFAMTPLLDIGDSMVINWSNGSKWINLLTTHDETEDKFANANGYKFFGFKLPSEAANKNNVTIKIICKAGGVNEVCDVDNFTIYMASNIQKSFFDDFESGSLSNKWITSGTGGAWSISSASPFTGSFHIRSEPSDLNGAFIATNITTQGYKNIEFSFFVKTPLLDAGDSFQVDWYNGSVWSNLLTTHNEALEEFDNTNGQYKFFGFRLPSEANNKDNISVRLACKAGAVNEVCDVDNFTITKVPIGSIWNFIFNTSGLSSGVYNYTVYANDSSSNIASSKSNFTIAGLGLDSTKPVINGTINKSLNNILQYDVLNASFTSTDETNLTNGSIIINNTGFNTLFNFTFNGSALISIRFSQNFSINEPAGTVINVTGIVRDGVGNRAQNETIFKVKEQVKPIINGTLNKSLASIFINDVINVSFNVTDETLLDTGQIIINDTGANRIFNFSLSGTEDKFSQNITISCSNCVVNVTGRVNDSSNNIAQNETIFLVQAEPVLDSTKPIINGSLNKTLSDTFQNDVINATYNITDNFNVSNATIIINQSGFNEYYNFTIGKSGASSIQISQNFTISSASGTVINITAIARDNSSNQAQNETIFTVSAVADTSVPVINVTINNTSPKINEYINISANITDEIGLSTANITYNQSGILTKINFTLSGTRQEIHNVTQITGIRGSVINFTVYVTDSSNNFKQISTLITITNTPPSGFSILHPSNNLYTKQKPMPFNITYANDPDLDTTTINYYINGKINDSTTTNTTFNGTDGTYILNVSLSDGNDISSNIAVDFTLDTTLPQVNGSLNKSLSNILQGDIINATFNATDNLNLTNATIIINQTGFNEYYNFTLNGSGTISQTFSQNFTITNQGTTVNITAIIRDKAGNPSQNETIFTTTSPTDTIPPAINASMNKTSLLKKNDVINLTANVSDETGLSHCQFIINQSGIKEFFNISISGNNEKCSQNFTISLTKGNVINFTAIVNDTSNNKNQSEFIITIANSIPNLNILYPNNLLNISLNKVNANVSFKEDPDLDNVTIFYYINGKLNTTSISNITIEAGDGIYILNVSLYDNESFSANSSVQFTIDTTNPSVLLGVPINGYINDSVLNVNLTFNGTIADIIALKNVTLFHNYSGTWKANLTERANAQNNFIFSLILLNKSFIWNVEACDFAGNCNFSSSNRTIILNLTSNSYLNILNFTPANNSMNVSLKSDITATFDNNVNESTLSNSTIIIRENNNTLRGKIKYEPDSNFLRFKIHRHLKENTTYIVNLTSDIRGQNGELFSGANWNFTTGLKDTDSDGIPDIEENDKDNDGLANNIDFINGNVSSIKTDIIGLDVKINQSTNLSKFINSTELMEFFINNSRIIEFNFTFRQNSVLDFGNLSVKQNENASKGSLIISGVVLNSTKAFYVDNISAYHGLCIKDADIDSISDISSYCNGSFETFVRCPGNSGKYSCIMNSTRFKVSGLNHSAVQQANDVVPPRINLISLSYQTGSIIVTLTVITDEQGTCKFDTSDTSYDNMEKTMSSNGLQHTGSVRYTVDTKGVFYVLCNDEFGNLMPSPSSIAFDADVPDTLLDDKNQTLLPLEKNVSCIENWVCESWTKCEDGFQTRECFDLNNCKTLANKPKTYQTCKDSCEEIWQCEPWGICKDGMMFRQCTDLSNCGTEDIKPNEFQECIYMDQCYNSVKDIDEEGVDCGGPCVPCETCFDRIQNQNEEGIDCGGVCRACRIGDLLTTGRLISIIPESNPDASFFIVLVLSVVFIFLAFRFGRKFKKRLHEKRVNVSEYNSEFKKDKIISKLKEHFNIPKEKNIRKDYHLAKEHDSGYEDDGFLTLIKNEQHADRSVIKNTKSRIPNEKSNEKEIKPIILKSTNDKEIILGKLKEVYNDGRQNYRNNQH